MNELVQPILALGGFGYLNYLVYSRIDNPDFGSDSDKKLIILLYSSMNYAVFLSVKFLINDLNMVEQIGITILISFILSLFLPIMSRLFLWVTNEIRMKFNLAKIENTKLKNKVLESTKNDVIFVFSALDNKFIEAGYKGGNSRKYEDWSLSILSFYGNELYCRYENKDNLMDFLEDKKIKVEIYINLDKNIKIISFPSVAVEQTSEEDEKK